MKLKTKLTFLFGALLLLIVSCSDEDNCDCPTDILGKWEAQVFLSLESRGYSKNADYHPTIEFKEDGTIAVKLDINACFGSFETGEEATINISDSGCTEACCDSEFSQKFMEMLPQVRSYEIDGEALKLYVQEWGWIQLTYLSK